MSRLGFVIGGIVASLASTSSPAREVLVGLTPIDADTTTLQAIDLDAAAVAPRLVDEIRHRPGYAPVGIVMDDHTIAAVVALAAPPRWARR